jgi:transglutaminase-like putative cysteine protease
VVERSGDSAVVDVGPSAPSDADDPLPPKSFYEANTFVNSGDEEIVRTAKTIVGETVEPEEKCRLLERWVKSNMKIVNFSTAFAGASEVMKSRSGDCTEHAVLLAALMRAAGVPSRTAIGLIYSENQNRFGYHMWTEAYFGAQWRPYDATLGLGRIGAGHIKLADSALDGTDAMAAFVPLNRYLGGLKIEVMSIDDKPALAPAGEGRNTKGEEGEWKGIDERPKAEAAPPTKKS